MMLDARARAVKTFEAHSKPIIHAHTCVECVRAPIVCVYICAYARCACMIRDKSCTRYGQMVSSIDTQWSRGRALCHTYSHFFESEIQSGAL